MRDLTKWPRLLVVGEPVTARQAEEIIIRTNHWYLITNDTRFERDIYAAAGIALRDESYVLPDAVSLRDFERRHHVLSLSYLHNHRIVSSWIGGPHGWVDWDGNVGCDNYNVGKWPGRDEVLEDWEKIAEAFPYLNLRAQLLPDEGECEAPAVEYRMHNGVVEMINDPSEFIARVDKAACDRQLDTMIEQIFDKSRVHGSPWEHGASIERIVDALSHNMASVEGR